MADAAATVVLEGGDPIASATGRLEETAGVETADRNVLSDEEDPSKTDEPMDQDHDDLATFDQIKAKNLEESTEIPNIEKTCGTSEFDQSADAPAEESSENKDQHSENVIIDTTAKDIETSPNYLTIESNINESHVSDHSSHNLPIELSDSVQPSTIPTDEKISEISDDLVESVKASSKSAEVNKHAENILAAMPLESTVITTESMDAVPQYTDAVPQSTDTVPQSTDAVPQSTDAVTESADGMMEFTESTDALTETLNAVINSTDTTMESPDVITGSTDAVTHSTDANLESTDANLESTDANLESTDVNLETTDANLESTDALKKSIDAVMGSTNAVSESTDAATESNNAMTESTDAVTKSTESLLVTANELHEFIEHNSELPNEITIAEGTGVNIKIEVHEHATAEAEQTADETDVFIKSELPEDIEMAEQTNEDIISTENQLNGTAEVQSARENGNGGTSEGEGDEERTVTMLDVLQEQEEMEDNANAVLGASDDNNCTYSEGYIKRQALYACLTCCSEARVDSTKRAGVCLACSLSCHENHELIELYTKRNFRCDCGNPNFNSNPCTFTKDKTEFNLENKYNQNFSALYCICHRPYPDPEFSIDDEMIQCIVCEDWLHASHLDAVVPENDQYSEMICKSCMQKNEFLHDYSCYAVKMEENYQIDVLNCDDILRRDLDIASKSFGMQQQHLVIEPDQNIEMEISTEGDKKASSKDTLAESIQGDNLDKISKASDQEVPENIADEFSKNSSEVFVSDNLILEGTATVTNANNNEGSIMEQGVNTSGDASTVDTNKSMEVGDKKTESTISKSKTEEIETDVLAAEGIQKVIENGDVDLQTNSEEGVEKIAVDHRDTEKPGSSEVEEQLVNDTKIKSVENKFESDCENKKCGEKSKEGSIISSDLSNEATKSSEDTITEKKTIPEANISKESIYEESKTPEENITENKTISEGNSGKVSIPEESETSEENITENISICENNCKETLSEESKASEENIAENKTISEENICKETISEESKIAEDNITENRTICEENNCKETISEESKTSEEDIIENKTISVENSCKETISKESKSFEENIAENKTISRENNCEETLPEKSELSELVEQTKINETASEITESVSTEKELDGAILENTDISTLDVDMIEDVQKKAPANGLLEQGIVQPGEIHKEGNKLDSDIEMQEVPEEKEKDFQPSLTRMESTEQIEINQEQMEDISKCNTNKRKLSSEITENSEEEISAKKTKLNNETIKETDCKRPKPPAKRYKGATFWPCNWRQKLCSCTNCVIMYRDRDVLFLLDLEDTVTAYEDLGKAKNEGKSSQYENGLKALSSLDRIQQINALTEYNRMKDELLNYLISFKNRQEVVKVEDIEKFFSDIKPKKKPDGVYFCR